MYINTHDTDGDTAVDTLNNNGFGRVDKRRRCRRIGGRAADRAWSVSIVIITTIPIAKYESSRTHTHTDARAHERMTSLLVRHARHTHAYARLSFSSVVLLVTHVHLWATAGC